MKKHNAQNIKVGLFGGTFNPVHWGHLRLAEEIREIFNLSHVIYIPAHIPPHKKSDVISAGHRFAMVQLAISGNHAFQASDIELKRPGRSYSIDTIRHFHGLSEDSPELFFIMGMDAFREIRTWKDYPAFFSTCNFIVMARPGAPDGGRSGLLPADIVQEFTYRENKRCFVHTSGYRVYIHRGTLIDISSTAIRALARQGKSIKYLVPEAVERYIADNRLYHDS